MLDYENYRDIIPLWPTNKMNFLGGGTVDGLIGRRFTGLEADAVLRLIGDILSMLNTPFDTIAIQITLPSIASNPKYQIKVTGIQQITPPMFALPGGRALPSYLQGCLDAYVGNDYMVPTPEFTVLCHRQGEFWEETVRVVSFSEDYGLDDNEGDKG